MARRCSVERANKQIGGFASAKKNMVIQYEEEIEQLDIYVKPEEQAVYYVVNQKIEGQIAF